MAWASGLLCLALVAGTGAGDPERAVRSSSADASASGGAIEPVATANVPAVDRLSVGARLDPLDPDALGLELAVPRHLADGEEFDLPIRDLLAHGARLFSARFTVQEGAGRPLTKGTGTALSDLDAPLVFPHNFNRISGPDANSCAGCHNQPFGIAGGSGDVVANAFVAAHRFDRVDFGAQSELATVSSHDETGRRVDLSTVGNSRATVGLFGSGYVEMLAREITADLQRLRDRLEVGESVHLESKGIDFGTLRRIEDGRYDTSRVIGLPAASLATWGADDPPSLAVRPFHQSGQVASLREFTDNALNQHHGIQSSERFGAGIDEDGDGYVDEITRADLSALVVYQATLPVPGQVIPRDPIYAQAIAQGERLFGEVGCTSCHVSRLPLENKGHLFSEPGPFNREAQLNPGEAPPLVVDLNDRRLPTPRLVEDDGVTWVPVFSDFRLHDITSGADDPDREAIDAAQPPGRRSFFQGNSRFLTSRLWGVGNQAPYFHHGKLTTLREAVLRHAGEAADSRAAFQALSEHERDCVIEFLKSLQVLPPGTRHLVVDRNGAPIDPSGLLGAGGETVLGDVALGDFAR